MKTLVHGWWYAYTVQRITTSQLNKVEEFTIMYSDYSPSGLSMITMAMKVKTSTSS